MDEAGSGALLEKRIKCIIFADKILIRIYWRRLPVLMVIKASQFEALESR